MSASGSYCHGPSPSGWVHLATRRGGEEHWQSRGRAGSLSLRRRRRRWRIREISRKLRRNLAKSREVRVSRNPAARGGPGVEGVCVSSSGVAGRRIQVGRVAWHWQRRACSDMPPDGVGPPDGVQVGPSPFFFKSAVACPCDQEKNLNADGLQLQAVANIKVKNRRMNFSPLEMCCICGLKTRN